MEEYLKRNEFKPERSHIKRNYTPYDRLLLTDKIENNNNFIRSNRCKLREQQEEKYKNPRPQSKKINQPNISNNMNSILKNNLNYNNNYRSIMILFSLKIIIIIINQILLKRKKFL